MAGGGGTYNPQLPDTFHTRRALGRGAHTTEKPALRGLQARWIRDSGPSEPSPSDFCCLDVLTGLTYTKGKESSLKSIFLLPRPRSPRRCLLLIVCPPRGYPAGFARIGLEWEGARDHWGVCGGGAHGTTVQGATLASAERTHPERPGLPGAHPSARDGTARPRGSWRCLPRELAGHGPLLGRAVVRPALVGPVPVPPRQLRGRGRAEFRFRWLRPQAVKLGRARIWR